MSENSRPVGNRRNGKEKNMAHMEKFSRAQIGPVCGHFDRSKRDAEHINPELSKNNYNPAMTDQPTPQLDKIHKTINETPHRERKDLKVMISWIITLPKDMPGRDNPTTQRKFFESAYNFCRDRYGVNNVISAYVHLDEPNAQPHMHFAFVPVTKDNRICANDIMTRGELIRFHKELDKHIQKELNISYTGILNQNTKEGNKSIAELKRMTATKQLQEAQEALKKASLLKVEIEALKLAKNEYKRILTDLERDTKIEEEYPDYAKKEKRGVFKKETVIRVPLEKWKKICKTREAHNTIEEALDKIDIKINKFMTTTSAKWITDLIGEVLRQEGEIQEKEEKEKALESEIKKLEEEKEYLIGECKEYDTTLDVLKESMEIIEKKYGEIETGKILYRLIEAMQQINPQIAQTFKDLWETDIAQEYTEEELEEEEEDYEDI